METTSANEESQIAVFRQAFVKRHLAEIEHMIDVWPTRRAALKARGAFATGELTLSGIATGCLQLGQISAIVDGDIHAAMCHFSYPAKLKQPTFKEIAALVAKGVEGRFAWDGQLLSMGSQLERLLCFLLVGRFDAIASDYAACSNSILFQPLDQEFARPFLTWQILYCATGQYDKVSFASFEKKRGSFKKSEFGFGYELLVDAVASGNSEKFSRELEAREAAFVRRQRSRKSDRMWGYGYDGRDCFDVFGSALCRLARARGLNFQAPSERFYPRAFWEGQAFDG